MKGIEGFKVQKMVLRAEDSLDDPISWLEREGGRERIFGGGGGGG